MRKKKASASDFDDILGTGATPIEEVSAPLVTEQETVVSTPTTQTPKRTKSPNDYVTTIRYPKKWKKSLQEQAIHEEVKINDLYVEALELLFANRGIQHKK